MAVLNDVKILVLNCGSSSLKYQLYLSEGSALQSAAKGIVEKIGEPGAPADHHQAVQIAFNQLIKEKNIEKAAEVKAVGHRFVHGGERFQQAVMIDEGVVQGLEEISDLAPLHNPVNLQGYRAAHELLPCADHVAVFDTAFHSTLPEHAFLFGLPYRFYEDEKIRRYGFHGISHRYLWQRYVELTGESAHKIVTCHLGNGCSVAAIQAGQSMDTSMGFTPLDGLLMGTRAGDLDAGVILHLMQKRQMSAEQIQTILNHESGLLGVSGVSSDMREVVAAAEEGNHRARVAIEIFCYRIRKYIGAYAAAMNGLDAVVFSGGIGEHAWQIRKEICSSLGFIGIRLMEKVNQQIVEGRDGLISEEQSSTTAWVIPTNEELMIAEDVLSCIQS